MQKNWSELIRKINTYQRSDRNAILILAALIFVVIVANIILKRVEPKPESDFDEFGKVVKEWEKLEENQKKALTLFDFDPNTISPQQLDSLSLSASFKRNLLNYRKAGGRFYKSTDLLKIYGMNDSLYRSISHHIKIKQEAREKIKRQKIARPKNLDFFDPNKADFEKLTNLGFSRYQANNLINYRSKGGIFENPEDLLKVYGIDSSFYFRCMEFIRIKKQTVQVTVDAEEELRIELNSADSAVLVQLSGIGPVYARRIIKYRSLLGGFYSKTQVKEVYNLPEETYSKIEKKLYVDTLRISRLRINFVDYQELIRHPYLNKNDVNLIIKTRETKGAYKNIWDVAAIQGFETETFSKIIPYITCN